MKLYKFIMVSQARTRRENTTDGSIDDATHLISLSKRCLKDHLFYMDENQPNVRCVGNLCDAVYR